MSVLDSLPDRPLRRAEVDSLDNSEQITGNFPVYSDLEPNTAYGLVLVVDSTAYALSYVEDGDGWKKVDDAEVSDTPGEGVHFDDMEIIQDLQDTAGRHAGAVDV